MTVSRWILKNVSDKSCTENQNFMFRNWGTYPRVTRWATWSVSRPDYITKEQSAHRVGGDSSVGIATRYGLGGPGIETRWEARFSAPVQLPTPWVPELFRWVKLPERGIDHPPPSSAEVKETEAYLYSPSGPSWPILGRTLPFFTFKESNGRHNRSGSFRQKYLPLARNRNPVPHSSKP